MAASQYVPVTSSLVVMQVASLSEYGQNDVILSGGGAQHPTVYLIEEPKKTLPRAFRHGSSGSGERVIRMTKCTFSKMR